MFFAYDKTTKYHFYPVDLNGTIIGKEYSMNVRNVHIGNKYVKKYSGYHFVKKVNGKNKRVTLVYRPTKSASQILEKVKKANYVGATFVLKKGIGKKFTKQTDNLGHETYRLRILLSNDGIKWSVLDTNYPNISIRDPAIMRMGKWWYVIYTDGMIKTKDFYHWKKVDWNFSGGYAKVWAPELIRMSDASYIISSNSQENSQFSLYLSPMQKDAAWDKINISGNTLTSIIDPTFINIFGTNYIFYKDEVSRTIYSAYTSTSSLNYGNARKLNIPNPKGLYFEAPEVMIIQNGSQIGVRLYMDTYKNDGFYGEMYTESYDGLKNWSAPKKIQANTFVRHFGFCKN